MNSFTNVTEVSFPLSVHCFFLFVLSASFHLSSIINNKVAWRGDHSVPYMSLSYVLQVTLSLHSTFVHPAVWPSIWLLSTMSLNLLLLLLFLCLLHCAGVSIYLTSNEVVESQTTDVTSFRLGCCFLSHSYWSGQRSVSHCIAPCWVGAGNSLFQA